MVEGHTYGCACGFERSLAVEDDKKSCVREKDIHDESKEKIAPEDDRDRRYILYSYETDEEEVHRDDRDNLEGYHEIIELEDRPEEKYPARESV